MLFGLVALQQGFVSQDRLLAAFKTWSERPDADLAEIVFTQGSLNTDQQALLERLVQQHLQEHGWDPIAGIQALSSLHSIRDQLLPYVSPGTQDGDPAAETVKWQDPLKSTEDVSTEDTSSGGYAAGGRFVVGKILAKGGLGSVSVARDLELNRHVAFKEILPQHADRLEAQVRFKREAEITGGLEHPGIVPVYGFGSYDDGRPFYAMKLIRGDSLKDVVARFHEQRKKGDVGFSSLEFRNLLRRMIDVCNAIQYAHDRGVLHRDLKPGNIMLGKYGETLVVDWGLAKPLAEQAERNRRPPVEASTEELLKPRTSFSQYGAAETQTGYAVGTPAYMSPEQARGEWDLLGPATDVYALGATLYSVLSGEPPIRGRDAVEAIQGAAAGKYVPLRTIVPTAPRALDAICRKAMSNAPALRYPDPQSLASDLERWLADEAVSVWKDGWHINAQRRLRKWSLVTSNYLVLVVLTGLVASVTVFAVAVNANFWHQSNKELLEQVQLAGEASVVRQRFLANLYWEVEHPNEQRDLKWVASCRETIAELEGEEYSSSSKRNSGVTSRELVSALIEGANAFNAIGERDKAHDFLKRTAEYLEDWKARAILPPDLDSTLENVSTALKRS